MLTKPQLRLTLALFILGFAGVLSSAVLIPQLLELQAEAPPIPIEVIQLLSVAQSAVLLLVAVVAGVALAPRVGLGAPFIQNALAPNANDEAIDPAPRPDLQPARAQALPALLSSLVGGVAGGLIIVTLAKLAEPLLPADFVSAGSALSLPWYTRLLYGGITEELLIRWGLMTALVWVFARLSQRAPQAQRTPRTAHYVLAIVLSALLFGAGHLPTVFALTSAVTPTLVIYIVAANAAFGLIAGYLYWRFGLESAIGAHMLAHTTMLVTAGFV